jgi:hypothetical protein
MSAGVSLMSTASAVVSTHIDMQVSNDGVNWSGTAYFGFGPTTNVYVRALVSYTGTASPVGLASFIFQPTVSNAIGTDVVLPFINGGVGGNTSTPLGVLTGGQVTDTTSFGRVSPWGSSATTSTSAIHGFFHTNPNGDGVNYLRIAKLQATSWIGGAGNTTGGNGVPISQLSDVGRTTIDPPFDGGMSSVYVFKFGLQLDTSHGFREDMYIEAPAQGFGNRNSATGEREVYWFANTAEATGSIRGTASVTTARIIFFPSPGSLVAVGAGGLAVGRRRR